MKKTLLSAAKMMQGKYLLFLCQEKVAFVQVSGIITTNLGKTATLAGIAGREKTDTSLQNMPFSQTGEGHFFWPRINQKKRYKSTYNQQDSIYTLGAIVITWPVAELDGCNIQQGRRGAVYRDAKRVD